MTAKEFYEQYKIDKGLNYCEGLDDVFALMEEYHKALDLLGVDKSLKCDCKHSGNCRYEEVILETKELCRHKE